MVRVWVGMNDWIGFMVVHLVCLPCKKFWLLSFLNRLRPKPFLRPKRPGVVNPPGRIRTVNGRFDSDNLGHFRTFRTLIRTLLTNSETVRFGLKFGRFLACPKVSICRFGHHVFCQQCVPSFCISCTRQVSFAACNPPCVVINRQWQVTGGH